MNFLEKLKNTKYKKTIGVILIIYGFVALVTPFSPGSWLAFIGLELLGFELVFLNKFFKRKK